MMKGVNISFTDEIVKIKFNLSFLNKLKLVFGIVFKNKIILINPKVNIIDKKEVKLDEEECCS